MTLTADPATDAAVAAMAAGEFNFIATPRPPAPAIELPNEAELRSNEATTLLATGDAIGATAIYREAVAMSPADARMRSNLLMCELHNWEMPLAVMAQDHRDWQTYCGAPLAQYIKPLTNDRDPNRKLRVAYISSDFRLHPVGFFFVPLVENHDPEKFEVHCLADVPKPDFVSERIQKAAFAWHEISGKNDEQVAQMVRDLGIDILVDLAGHTGNRVPVLPRCPAPVQVSYLGYSFTLGIPSVQYRFTDAICDPVGVTDSLHVEKLIRLPEVVGCFEPLVEAPDVEPTPAIKNGFVTVGCFQRAEKLSEPTVNLWGKIFAQGPNIKLLLLVGNAVHRFPTEIERVRKWFETHGIDRSRIELRPKVPYADYLLNYHDVDFILDSSPFNGHTTSLQAMWMGVPSVTLLGKTYQSRMGASILTNVGLPELIAHTPEEYVRIGVELARDIPRLAALRAGMRERLRQSPITQPKRLAAAIEDNYRKMWQAWCRGATL